MSYVQQQNRRRSAKNKQKYNRAKRSRITTRRAKEQTLPKTKNHVEKEMDLNDVLEALSVFFFNTIQQNEKPKHTRRHVGPSLLTGPSIFNTPDILHVTTPTLSEIRDFVSLIFEKRRLAAETGVVALVLIMRTRIKVNATNWMRLIMLGMLLANKEAEDVYNVWNVRYVGIIPNLPGYEINVLEMEFLQYLNYRLHVERPTYDKYYLQLHVLVPERPEKEEEVEEHILEDLPELPEYLEEQEPEQETETEMEIETEVDPEPQEQEMDEPEPATEEPEPETETGEPETEEPESETGEPETVTEEPETETGEPEPETEELESESETELEPNEPEQETETEDSEQDQEPETDLEPNEPETMEPDETGTEMEKIAEDLILQSEHVIHLVPRSCFSRTCPVRHLAFLPGRSDQIISRVESIP